MRISDWSSDVCSSDLAPGKVPTPFKAVVQRLKYQHSYTDIGRLCDLVESASGRWSQLGYRLDRYREMARGPFAAQGLADIFALLCLSPWLRPAVMKLNGLFHKADRKPARSEEHTSELQSLMRTSYAVFCLKKKNKTQHQKQIES